MHAWLMVGERALDKQGRFRGGSLGAAAMRQCVEEPGLEGGSGMDVMVRIRARAAVVKGTS